MWLLSDFEAIAFVLLVLIMTATAFLAVG